MNTTLKAHPLYKGYFLTPDGRVFSTKRTDTPVELKTFGEKNGYRSIYLYHQGKAVFQRIHQLVADTFIPKPEGVEGYNIIHHKDKDKTNNHYTNLLRCRDLAEHARIHHEERRREKALLQGVLVWHYLHQEILNAISV